LNLAFPRVELRGPAGSTVGFTVLLQLSEFRNLISPSHVENEGDKRVQAAGLQKLRNRISLSHVENEGNQQAQQQDLTALLQLPEFRN
jgi:hypothetical protein